MRRHQKKKNNNKEIERNTADFSTGAAVGQHELSNGSNNDHAAIAIAAANGKMPADQIYEKQGQAMSEAPPQGQRFYENYASQPHEMYGDQRYEPAGNTRYEMGPDRRLHELDGMGRRF